MSFREPIEFQIIGVKARAYIQAEARVWISAEVEGEIESVFKKNQGVLGHGNKYILLLWEEAGKKMVDWWIVNKPDSETSGATLEVHMFKDGERYESPIVTAIDGLEVLSREVNLK